MRRMSEHGPAARIGLASRPDTRRSLARIRGGGFFPRSVLLPPYFPYFYPAYDFNEYEPIATPAPPLQVIAAQPAPAPAPAATPVESVVLEYQAGQWVRVSNYSQSQARGSTQPDSTAESTPRTVPTGAKEAVPSPAKLPPAVLVFRDGHNEEVERYMIRGDVIFADANYWSTGSWTRKVPIVELDISATKKINEERGVKFTLPAGPNEVIIR